MRPSFVYVPLALALSSVLLVGCKTKPSEKACKEAIENVRRISGQDMSDVGADPTAAIRSCRGNSSKQSVECMRTAKNIEDLRACEGEAGEAYFQEAAEHEKKQADESAAKADKEATSGQEATAPAAVVAPATDTQANQAPADEEQGATDTTDAATTGAQ